MKIGISDWGHLGNRLHDPDSPSGISWHFWSVINHFLDQDNQVFWMQEDRDAPGVYATGETDYFGGHFPEHRERAWREMIPVFPRGTDYREHFREFSLAGDNYRHSRLREYFELSSFPELDILLLNWRWPIAGRNVPNKPLLGPFHPDWVVQQRLLEHYSQTPTRIVVWDLDHYLDVELFKEQYPGSVVFAPELVPRPGVIKLLMPFPTGAIIATNCETPKDTRYISYIGSRYERDDHIEKWLAPFSDSFPYCVHLYGNWRKYPSQFRELLERWPNFCYYGRVSHPQFRELYSTSAAVPLLAKESYRDTGFVTNRLLEALYFGSVPVGFNDFCGIEQILPEHLIATSSESFENIVLSQRNLGERLMSRTAVLNEVRDAFSLERFYSTFTSEL